MVRVRGADGAKREDIYIYICTRSYTRWELQIITEEQVTARRTSPRIRKVSKDVHQNLGAERKSYTDISPHKHTNILIHSHPITIIEYYEKILEPWEKEKART